MIIGVDKIKRNEKCHCGSGRKYKNCCLEVDERRKNPKSINQKGLFAILRHLLKKENVIYNISFQELKQIPQDEGINITYKPEDDSFDIQVVKIVKKKILTPDKRLRVPIIGSN